MHISYSGIVNRRSNDNGEMRYVCAKWEIHAISSWPEHKAAVKKIEQAECDFSVNKYNLADKYRHDEVEEMLIGAPEAEAYGCVLISAYPNLHSGFMINIVLGTECEFPPELETSLHSPHLGIEASFEIPFSLYEENQYIVRPVTFSQFENGRRVVVSGIPNFSLIRKHVP